MKIHEFLSAFGDEVCEACVDNLRQAEHERSEQNVTGHVRTFMRQVIAKLRRADGLPEESAVPELRETAASVGHDVQQNGLSIDIAAQSFAMLSVSLGEVGGRYGLAFDAGEYKSFNEAIDHGVAFAIEQFMKDTRAEHEHATSERVGFLAHELRNAVASAKMAFTTLEKRQEVSDPTAGTIRRSFRRMESLIEQALVEVRLTESPPPPLRSLRLTPLLREIEADAILERQIHFALETDESLAIAAAEQLVTVAVGNLVQNAIKCSHDGAVITLRARRDLDAVVVEVEDECGGLPPGAVEELFKPFVQQHADRRGLGLGLAIARRAANAVAAEITVRDLPGKGCVFAVRFRPAEDLETGDVPRFAPPSPLGMSVTRS